MLYIPRTYQTEAVNSVWTYFQQKRGNPIIAMPTGTGKSLVIAMFLESVFRAFPNQKILVLTHVKELIQQNFSKLMALWPGAPAGINSAGLGKRDFHDRIVFAGIASVAKYAAAFGHVDIVVVDECHLVSPTDETMYQNFFKQLTAINPHLKIVGLTATPWRLGHGRITEDGGIFTDVCFDITGLEAFNRLIAEGYLCPLVPKKTQTMLDTTGVHMRGGEFIASELQDAVDRDEITERALRESLEMGRNRHKWLIFASGVHHAHTISEMLTSMGLECPAVTSDMSEGARNDLIGPSGAFRTGRVNAVVNNNVLTTGLDVPDIDFIVVLRPTASPVLWVQMLGRGTRPFSCAEWTKENCLVGDFAGNTRRLGPINDPVIPQKKGKKGGDAPVRLCERCETYNHASLRYCGGKPPPNVKEGYCGYEFPVSVKLKMEASTEQLIKGEMPVVEVFPVAHVTCTTHTKMDRPDAVKVSYYCGLNKRFDEYVCIAHDGYAGRKARMWWREHGHPEEEMPTNAQALLERIGNVRMPTHLRVWTNKKYPEIMSQCFDGSAFGTVEVGEAFEAPPVEVQAPRREWKPNREITGDIQGARSSESYSPDTYDDDIPF